MGEEENESGFGGVVSVGWGGDDFVCLFVSLLGCGRGEERRGSFGGSEEGVVASSRARYSYSPASPSIILPTHQPRFVLAYLPIHIPSSDGGLGLGRGRGGIAEEPWRLVFGDSSDRTRKGGGIFQWGNKVSRLTAMDQSDRSEEWILDHVDPIVETVVLCARSFSACLISLSLLHF